MPEVEVYRWSRRWVEPSRKYRCPHCGSRPLSLWQSEGDDAVGEYGTWEVTPLYCPKCVPLYRAVELLAWKVNRLERRCRIHVDYDWLLVQVARYYAYAGKPVSVDEGHFVSARSVKATLKRIFCFSR